LHLERAEELPSLALGLFSRGLLLPELLGGEQRSHVSVGVLPAQEGGQGQHELCMLWPVVSAQAR
jgi:hypothetical protein